MSSRTISASPSGPPLRFWQYRCISLNTRSAPTLENCSRNEREPMKYLRGSEGLNSFGSRWGGKLIEPTQHSVVFSMYFHRVVAIVFPYRSFNLSTEEIPTLRDRASVIKRS